MDKKEALEIATKIFEVCEPNKDCFGCPFEDTFERVRHSGFCLISSLLEDACVNDKSKYERIKKVLNEVNKATENEGNMIPGAIFDISKENYVTKHDNVNSPKHYCKGGLECIQVIKAQLTQEQYKGYLYGNVLKYMWRWQDKNGLEDLRKAEHYLKWLMEEVKK